jgi:hypothetical protein
MNGQHRTMPAASAASSSVGAMAPPPLPSPPPAVAALPPLPAALQRTLIPAVQAALHQWGTNMHTQWVTAAVAHVHATMRLPALSAYVAGASHSDAVPAISLTTAVRAAVWPLVIDADLLARDTGMRRLPADLESLHRQVLDGVHLLQLYEARDIAHSASELAETPRRGDRVWKMLLTDGEDMYAAFEKTKCANLTHERMRQGVKVSCCSRPAAGPRVAVANVS